MLRDFTLTAVAWARLDGLVLKGFNQPFKQRFRKVMQIKHLAGRRCCSWRIALGPGVLWTDLPQTLKDWRPRHILVGIPQALLQ